MDFSIIQTKIKRYLVFTSLAYRTAVCAVTALLLAAGAYAGHMFREQGLFFTAGILSMAEIVSDYWLFSGIQAKESQKMDFLRTSGLGMGILRDALTMDLLRKFLTALGILAGAHLLAGLPGGFLYMVLISYACSVLGTFFSRYGSMFLANACMGQLTAAAVFGCLFCMSRMGALKYEFMISALFLALGTGASVLAVSEGMRKVEGGYEDE